MSTTTRFATSFATSFAMRFAMRFARSLTVRSLTVRSLTVIFAATFATFQFYGTYQPGLTQFFITFSFIVCPPLTLMIIQMVRISLCCVLVIIYNDILF